MPAILVFLMLGSTFLVGPGSSDEVYPGSPKIERMSISAEINNNYAVTEISEILWNPSDAGASMTFSFEIPEKAFISNFSMTVDGETTYAQIVSKDTGQEEFQQAVMNGTDAGLVESYGKSTFSYSVSMSAYERMGISLRYEEFLEKSLGGYEYRVPLADSSIYYPIEDFSVNIHLKSEVQITSADVENYPATLNWVSSKELDVSYEYGPDEYGYSCALYDDFVLNYELESLPVNGRMLNYADGDTGYFMHIFSPQRSDIGGRSMPKDIIFVLDKSGSMNGEKISQLKDAFSEIIWQLPEQDNFNIILFDSQISIYSHTLLSATENNRSEAVNYINGIAAGGSTNINEAMTSALDMFEISETRVPIIVMLTDGLPTAGVTDTSAIRENVLNANSAGVSIFCLGFGYDVDFDFLKAMALENGGIAIRIYEGQDAGAQITNFYDTISTPLLRDLNFAYEGGYEVYPTHVEQLFEGTEVVVVGKYPVDKEEIKSTVTATSWEGTRTFEDTFILGHSVGYDFIPRFWAYAKIRYLLNEIAVRGEEPALVENVSSLALDYGFVTPYTSFLVKPTIDGGGSTEEGSEGYDGGYKYGGNSSLSPPPASGSNGYDTGSDVPVPPLDSTPPTAPSGGDRRNLLPETVPAEPEKTSTPFSNLTQIVLLLIGTVMAILAYTKIQKYRLLEQEKREQIFHYIEEHPGAHFRAIQRALGMEVGVLSHHINKLEKGDYIRSRQDGMYRRFYPMNSKIELKLILSDVEKRILAWVRKHPGASQRDIADSLKISRKVVNYHLKVLSDSGFVRMVKDGRKTLSYPNREDI